MPVLNRAAFVFVGKSEYLLLLQHYFHFEDHLDSENILGFLLILRGFVMEKCLLSQFVSIAVILIERIGATMCRHVWCLRLDVVIVNQGRIVIVIFKFFK